MDEFRTLSIKEKSLKINLDKRIYGSFAEIGAGQDTAAAFFKAGGASGTIAKTMSAYDMAFSDAIYGKCARYVCEERLETMLEREFGLLEKRLTHRKDTTCFFAYANTVETINFKKNNKGHGWVGLRFQLAPDTPYNECVIHVLMRDRENVPQQQAIGMVGVNMLYGCFYLHHDPEALLSSLVDNLSEGRVEIDMFRLTGPDFKHVDNRLMSLKLVKNGLAQATMFSPGGQVLQAFDALYKKDVAVLRGRFRPVTKVNMDMLNTGLKQFQEEPDVDPHNTLLLCELTLSDLTSTGQLNEKDFLDRVDILCSLGQYVMISNFPEFYKLISYMSQFTKKKKIGIIVGIMTLEKIFEERHYTDLKGGILEAVGILFGNNVTLYVYPSYGKDKTLHTCQNFKLEPKLKSLLDYLIENRKIEDLKGADTGILHITSDHVISMIKSGTEGWEDMVPETVADIIKDNCLFDYPCAVDKPRKLKKTSDGIKP
jgi:hypothetical protein